MVDCGSQPQGNRAPFVRGGPIYIPDLVSPITSVLDFKNAIVDELRNLEAELCSVGNFDDELSVDELRVFTEEELVEKALKEGFEDKENGTAGTQVLECSNEMKIDDVRDSDNDVLLESDANVINKEQCRSSNGPSISSTDTHGEQQIERKSLQNLIKRRKRGRFFDRDTRAAELEEDDYILVGETREEITAKSQDRMYEAGDSCQLPKLSHNQLRSHGMGSYFAKVEQLAKIKKRQDEDKAAARLHSFNGSSKPDESISIFSDKVERMRALRFITSPLKVKSPATLEHVPISYPEVVLCVEIYNNRANKKKTQEFLVLGRQMMTELRDNIYCLTDRLMQATGQHDPSGYFLIEDCFYNDLRNPSAIDYSRPILDWLRNCKSEAEEKWEPFTSVDLKKKQKDLLGNLTVSKLPNLRSNAMHKIRFCDLQFRLGVGYLYCHQGDCKHVIVIRDMRFIHPEDNQNMLAYPIRTFQIKVRCRKCSVCDIYRATKVTVDDKWAQMNPCHFCDNCYYLLHYNEEGSLLYTEFTVYDYHHE